MYYSKKINNYEFHSGNLILLERLGKIITESEKNFNWKKYGDNKKDEQGWWMIIKESIITKYMGAFLRIHRREPKKNLFYIDLTSGPGLCEVTKNEKKEKFDIPGSALLAALRNQDLKYHFDKIFANDIKFENRDFLDKRLVNLIHSQYIKKKIDYYIPSIDQKINSDSNLIIDDLLEIIKKEGNGFFACLFVIDNQGLDIKWNTIEKIIKFYPFCDLIINFPTTGFNRTFGNWKRNKTESTKKTIESFMGIDINQINSHKDAIDKYVNNLKRAGKEIVETFEVKAGGSAGSFHYTLLFAVRETLKGSKWMRMFEKYRKRYSSMTGEKIKHFFDINISKKQTSLTHYF